MLDSGYACMWNNLRPMAEQRWRGSWARRPRTIWSARMRQELLRWQSASVQPVLVPASVFCLGRDRYPKARAMLDAGLAVVLATDFNPGSSPTTSMPFVMSLACQQMKMLPSEALTAATINAACSLGLGEVVGSLEVGKAADFLIHEFHDYRELAYFAAVPNLPQVFVAGQRVQTCSPSSAKVREWCAVISTEKLSPSSLARCVDSHSVGFGADKSSVD